MAGKDGIVTPFGLEPKEQRAEIGVFGGSGFYDLLEDAETVAVETPYGRPSAAVTLGSIAGRKVAFMPRHGADHSLPPHKINYRANVWAFKALGISWVVSPCAAGSLQKHVEPGDFVICDQYVDRTNGRADTFYDGPITTHVSAADPYSKTLSGLAFQAAKDCGIKAHDKGTIVVIQGPRFSTRAESKWYRDQGWEVINMTQYPEVHLVKELGMDPVNISLITDYDTGVEGIEPVSHAHVLKVFSENNAKLKKLLYRFIELMPTDPATSECRNVLASAR